MSDTELSRRANDLYFRYAGGDLCFVLHQSHHTVRINSTRIAHRIQFSLHSLDPPAPVRSKVPEVSATAHRKRIQQSLMVIASSLDAISVLEEKYMRARILRGTSGRILGSRFLLPAETGIRSAGWSL